MLGSDGVACSLKSLFRHPCRMLCGTPFLEQAKPEQRSFDTFSTFEDDLIRMTEKVFSH